MKCTTRRMAMAAAALGLMVGQARADVTITIEQVGSDVVATGSGSIDLTGLSFNGNGRAVPHIDASIGIIYEGQWVTSDVTGYSGIQGPGAFGSADIDPSSGSGDLFGVAGNAGEIVVPAGYVSGNALSATDYYDNQTLASLGLTPGTYVYTWGSGIDADSLTVNIISPAAVVPEPSTAIVAVFGGAAFLAYGWSRRRELRRQAAA